MTQFSKNEKYAIITMLSQIMNADGIIHPKEEKYMNHVYVKFGITIGDLENMTNMDEIQAMAIVNDMQSTQKQYVKNLFMSMAKADGVVHPLETIIIEKL